MTGTLSIDPQPGPLHLSLFSGGIIMKHLVRIIIGLAGIFAAFCAFVGVVEHLCTRLSFSPEEGNKVEKIQFDLDTD